MGANWKRGRPRRRTLRLERRADDHIEVFRAIITWGIVVPAIAALCLAVARSLS